MWKHGERPQRTQWGLRYNWDTFFSTTPPRLRNIWSSCFLQTFDSTWLLQLSGFKHDIYPSSIAQALHCFITCSSAMKESRQKPDRVKWIQKSRCFNKTASSSNTQHIWATLINRGGSVPAKVQHLLRALLPAVQWDALFINPVLECHFQTAQSSQRCPGLAFFLTCDKHKMAAPTPVGLHKTVKTSLRLLPSTPAARTLPSTTPPARNSLPAHLPADRTHGVFVLHKSSFHRTVSPGGHVFFPGLWR